MKLTPEAQRAAQLGFALHTPVRAGLLDALTRSGGESLSSYASRLGVTLGSVSHHVAILARAGVVTLEPVAREKLVRLAPAWREVVTGLFSQLEKEGEDGQ